MAPYLVSNKRSRKTHILTTNKSHTVCGIELLLDSNENERWRKHAGGCITCERCWNNRYGF